MGHGQIGFTVLTWVWIILEESQKGVRIKLIPISLSSSFRRVVTTLQYKNGPWSNLIYNVNMDIEHPRRKGSSEKKILGWKRVLGEKGPPRNGSSEKF